MKTNLNGKTAIVTGAADGIGKECALHLAASGADIVVADLNLELAQCVAETIKGMGRKAIALRVDLWDYDSVKEMTDKAIAEMGKIELLVASGATTTKYAKFVHQYDPKKDFEGVFRTQQWSRLYPIFAVFEHMKGLGYGKIVVITSDAGRTPTPREAFVGACAAGLIVVDKVMAMEWARHGIRVNTLCLTIINNSPAMKSVMATEAEHIFKKTFERARFGVPEMIDVAEAALYFCSPETDKITGSVFSINGGLSFQDKFQIRSDLRCRRIEAIN